MSRRHLLGLVLLAALAANTASGAIKIAGFIHRHAGEMALANGSLDEALAHLTSARGWQPGDGPTHVLIGRVISLALANGLPLEVLAGHQPDEIFARGFAEVALGIALNPADAWSWFNLVNAFESARSARVRLDVMKRAGERARAGAAPDQAPPGLEARSRLEPEDLTATAAALESIDLEPATHVYHDYLARLLWDRGLKTEAAREIRTSLALWPRFEAHAPLADEAFLHGLSDAILQGIDASRDNRFAGPAMAARGRAVVLERLGRLDEAIQAYQALRDAGDASGAAECDVEMGRLELQRSRPAESLPYFERVIHDAPASSQADWAWYFMGLAQSALGDRAKAISSLTSHLARVPDSLPGIHALAREEEAAGRSEEAERLFISAVRLYPQEPETYVQVIQQMRKHGKAKQALSYAQGLSKVDPGREGIDDLIRQLEAESSQKRP